MGPDAFLARFYRERERRSSPRVSSVEARIQGGYQTARDSEEWWTWACCVVGRAERELRRTDSAVLERYYLGLSNAHVSLVVRSSGSASAREVEQGETPDVAASLQSFVDWQQMARDGGGAGSDREVDELLDAWLRGRQAIARALCEVEG